MDIVWLIIAQALFANEWRNRSETSWHVVVHLRNMASATLALVGLFMHTSIEKAAIPANEGALLLAHPSPLTRDRGGPAAICFDERLHVDSFLSDANPDPSNMLSVRLLRATCFRLVTLANGASVVYYESMMRSGVSSWTPEHLGELFPYPPESVCHMQTHFGLLDTAYERLLSDDMKMGQSERTLPLALRLYGKSVESAMLHYIPATLTHCVARDGLEIPCMSFLGGFIFTLQVSHTRILVKRVYPTHLHVSPFAAEHDVEGCSALPLEEEPCSFSVTRLAEVMSRGLEYNGETVRMRPQWENVTIPRDEREGDRQQLLPFTPFPLVEWKTAVTLTVTHEQGVVDAPLTAQLCSGRARGSEPPPWEGATHVRLVPVLDFFESMAGMLTPVDRDSWEAANDDIPFPGEGCEVHEATLTHTGVRLQIYFVLRPRNKGGHAIFYFNSRAHLKHTLTEHADTPLSRTRYEAWVHKELLVATEPVHDPTSPGYYNMYPMYTAPDGVAADAVSFDDSESASLVAQRNNTLFKVGAMRKQETLLQSQVASVTGNTFAVEGKRAALQETLSKVSDTRIELEGEARRLLELICATKVKREWHASVHLGRQLCRNAVLGPWEGAGDLLMGIIKPHEEGGKYLLRGTFAVECCDVGVETPYRGLMDFVTASRCLLREGSRVYINVSREIYKELRSVEKGLRVEDDAIHKDATSASQEYFKLQLAAYYVLGSVTLAEKTAPCVRLMLFSENRASAQSEFEVDTDTSRQIILTVELYGEDNVPIVTTLRDEECPLVEGLVCVVGQSCISKPLRLGPGESFLWQ